MSYRDFRFALLAIFLLTIVIVPLALISEMASKQQAAPSAPAKEPAKATPQPASVRPNCNGVPVAPPTGGIAPVQKQKSYYEQARYDVHELCLDWEKLHINRETLDGFHPVLEELAAAERAGNQARCQWVLDGLKQLIASIRKECGAYCQLRHNIEAWRRELSLCIDEMIVTRMDAERRMTLLLPLTLKRYSEADEAAKPVIVAQYIGEMRELHHCYRVMEIWLNESMEKLQKAVDRLDKSNFKRFTSVESDTIWLKLEDTKARAKAVYDVIATAKARTQPFIEARRQAMRANRFGELEYNEYPTAPYMYERAVQIEADLARQFIEADLKK